MKLTASWKYRDIAVVLKDRTYRFSLKHDIGYNSQEALAMLVREDTDADGMVWCASILWRI